MKRRIHIAIRALSATLVTFTFCFPLLRPDTIRVHPAPIAEISPNGDSLGATPSTKIDVNHDQNYHCAFSPFNASECLKLLSPNVKNKPAWFYFGDSQMQKLLEHLEYPYPVTSKRVARDGRCGSLDFFNMPKASEWVPPTYALTGNQTQGPTAYGFEHPFCSDLRGHASYSVESKTSDDGVHYLERLIVEYASDVELQTPFTNTTQETTVAHLANKLAHWNLTRDDSVCVVNTGLHDQKLCLGKSEQRCRNVYLQNLKSYLDLLRGICGNIVWVSTSPVRGDSESPQRNDRTFDWNEEVKQIISGQQNAFYLDVWAWGLITKHKDNVHFYESYYKTIGQTIFAILM